MNKMNSSPKNKYQDYTLEVVLKRVFKYIKKSKWLILSSILFLMFFTLLELLQPLLVSEMLDQHLLGIQTTWVETNQQSETAVVYQAKYYEKLGDRPLSAEEHALTLFYFQGKYYTTAGQVAKSSIQSIEGNQATIVVEENTIVIPVRLLTTDDLQLFYKPSIQPIYIIIIIYGVLTIFITIFRYLQNIFFQTASMKLTLDMRAEAFAKLERLPIKYFTLEPSGKIVTKITSDSEGVRGLYQVLFAIIAAGISLVMVYIGLFIADWKLACITLCATPFILLWMTVYRKVNNKYHHRIREMNSVINASMAQYVDGMGMIQQFNKEQQMTKEYDSLLVSNYHNKMRALKINSVFGGELLLFIQNLLVAVVIFYFGRAFLTGSSATTAGLLYLYVTYISRIVDPIRDIFVNLNALEDSFVASSRIFELLDQPEDKYLGFHEKPNFQGKVTFEHVTFQYDADNIILKDISMEVQPGQFIGLVGHTGSGKSTMMTLLQRFYDLQTGRIFIDDIDFMQYTKQEVRSNIGYVLQDPAIFSGTIKSNIVLDMEDVSDDAVNKILEYIGGVKFITSYPEGIHTKLEYLGGNLSTGEKQLISFARILLRNPAILILDEATANIDTETEVLIQNALKVLATGRTTFVVAHRLSTIRHADQIYVLEDGKIVENGTHDMLYHLNGRYRKMYDAQYHKENKLVASPQPLQTIKEE